MIIDHIGLAISDFEKSKAFYSKALAPLDIQLITEVNGWAGYGRVNHPDFWFRAHKILQSPMHFAFLAQDRKTVDAFYQAAINAGGKDNGEPGIREIYHPNYYGAYIIDPDGHNIEAVCHKKQ